MTLLECLVALALAGIVSAAVATVLTAQARVLRGLTTQAADAEAYRITAGVLSSELRLLDPRNDVRSIAHDSIAVRLFRGAGAVCAHTDERLLIHYAGDRLPDPAKDSVLVRAAGGESAHALAASDSGTCGGRAALALRLDTTAPATAAFALVFESGTYFLRERALRYRLGASGRQPVTDERFGTTGPPLYLDSTHVRVPVPWPGDAPRRVDTLRIYFLNPRG